MEDTPAPYTGDQLLAALDYVVKSTGSVVFFIAGRVNVDGCQGGSTTEAAALWLDENAERLQWNPDTKVWQDRATEGVGHYTDAQLLAAIKLCWSNGAIFANGGPDYTVVEAAEAWLNRNLDRLVWDGQTRAWKWKQPHAAR